MSLGPADAAIPRARSDAGSTDAAASRMRMRLGLVDASGRGASAHKTTSALRAAVRAPFGTAVRCAHAGSTYATVASRQEARPDA